MNWKEFRPSLVFLGKFVGIYLIANLLYGLYVESYGSRPDSITRVVSAQTASLLRLIDYSVSAEDSKKQPTTQIRLENKSIVSIYEGCNGVNTAIIFIAFIVAFGPLNLKATLFSFGGLLVIHVANLLRIMWLFIVAIEYPTYLYFSHKYLFTAALYLVIFVLWMWWVSRLSKNADAKAN